MLTPEQKGVRRGALSAAGFSLLVLGLGYLFSPLSFSGINSVGDRLAFAIKVDLFVALWLIICVGNVANIRFYSSQDIKGSAFTEPSEKISSALGFLQNTLEQVVLAMMAHMALSVLLNGSELILIPLLAALFTAGRVAFWLGYRGGASARAFGFGTTFFPTVAAYLLAIGLLFVR